MLDIHWEEVLQFIHPNYSSSLICFLQPLKPAQSHKLRFANNLTPAKWNFTLSLFSDKFHVCIEDKKKKMMKCKLCGKDVPGDLELQHLHKELHHFHEVIELN